MFSLTFVGGRLVVNVLSGWGEGHPAERKTNVDFQVHTRISKVLRAMTDDGTISNVCNFRLFAYNYN